MIAALLLSMFVTLVLIPLLRWVALRFGILVDMPDPRKVHHEPMPRIGGLAIAVGVFLPILSWGPQNDFILAGAAGSALLVAAGLADDYRPMTWKTKLAAQIAAALLVILWGGVRIQNLGLLLPDGWLLPPIISIPLTLVAIVGVTNAINLSDGLDGLAGGICLLSFICIAFLAYWAGMTPVLLVAMAMSGAIFGFLHFNTYPANIFMGDAGSQFLGFGAIVLSLSLTQGNVPLSPLLPLLILGFPVLDTLTVMTTRIRRGNSPFTADKNHFHHQLMRIGLTHKAAVAVIYLLQTVLVLAAFFLGYHSEWLLLGGYVGFCVLVLAGFWAVEKLQWRFRHSELVEDFFLKKFEELKSKRIIIRYAFRIFEFGILALLVWAALLSNHKPLYLKWGATVAVVLLAIIWLLDRQRMENITKIVLYLMIPALVYFGETDPAALFWGWPLKAYHMAFALFALLLVVVLSFTTRREHFRVSPKDLLILVIAVVIPNLPLKGIADFHLGLIAAQIILFFFSFEVLFAEVRGEYGILVTGTGLAMLASLI